MNTYSQMRAHMQMHMQSVFARIDRKEGMSMPRKSRIRRLFLWFATLFRAFGALFSPHNLRNALRSITHNYKEYLCFYLATLVMGAGFWTVALLTESNLVEAKNRVFEEYNYHIEVAMLDNEQFVNLDQQLDYQIKRENEYIESYYWVNEEQPLADGTYSVRILLDDTFGLSTAYNEVHTDILNRVSQGRRDIRFTPLYTFDEDFGTPYTAQFWLVSLLWLAFSVLMLVALFLIRLDHFRFIYGIYMTCGADFPRLIGAAGGELMAITLLTALPSALVGFGIAAGLYLPTGVGLYPSVRGIVTVLLGSLLSVLISVWFPMRRLSTRPVVEHLTAGDNAGLVSSPRRSFFLFGESFPGKYELYGFWRMRKYYLRLVVSAVLFAAFFVTGLYIAEMESYHNDLDPAEYHVAYRPQSYYEYEDSEDETDEYGAHPLWTLDPEEAELVRGDVDVYLEELCEIPGVNHAMWEVSVTGGYKQSHLLITPGQNYDASSYIVSSQERASEGFKWAINNYAYTAIDETWIDHMLTHDLCTFEGDPYAILSNEKQLIISEDIYNEQTYDFKPGDRVIVAVCEEATFKQIVTDPQELLRNQIKANRFRYETYTVAAVIRGLTSEAHITLGVTYEDYAALTEMTPARTDLMIYMDKETDMDTVRAAEDDIRRLLVPFKDWIVTPTGNYFDARVRAVKNDDALILTLAACLLVISPMVWYFSQILFYRKRKNEFAILHALGAPDSAFAKLHRLAGGVLSGVAFLATVGLSYLCNYLIYLLIGTILPKLHLTESLYYPFTLSLPALIACVLISVLCGYLSCELPYQLYTQKTISESRPL